MKKLYVNKDACIGCGACVSIDSEHFAFGDDDLSEVISQENTDSANCQNAIASCPTGAIGYENDGEKEEEHCSNCCASKECDCHHEEVYDNDELDEA